MSNEKTTNEDQGGSAFNVELDGYSNEERYLHEMLSLLQEQYARAAKPYIDRLAQIHAMRMPAPMIITLIADMIPSIQGGDDGAD